jgi:hypothetical protein
VPKKYPFDDSAVNNSISTTSGKLYRALSELSASNRCHLDNNAEFIMSTDTFEDAVRTPVGKAGEFMRRTEATSIDTVGRVAPRAFKGNDDRLLGTS